MIMGTRIAIVGPWNENRGPWTIIMGQCNVFMGPWIVIM